MVKIKIICTIGPASSSQQILRQLMRAGMNVARLNFSHGTYAEYKTVIANIRAASKAVGIPIAIMQDLQGPRIRLGELREKTVTLKKRQEVILLPQSDFNHGHSDDNTVLLPLHYPLYHFVHAGQKILLKDGTVTLEIERKFQHKLSCRVVSGGTLASHQGINVPGAHIIGSALTKKDRDDLSFGIAQKVDAVALSFVRDHRDILQLRRLLPKSRGIQIIAKIERQEAVEQFSKILRVTDGIMIARGDLGVEMGPEDVPLLQKEMITDCLREGVPVIVATQMLESMIHVSRPTRAEAADVANAVIDHADALMLSGETATGEYPVEAVRTMRRIIAETERSRYDDVVHDEEQPFSHRRISPQRGVAVAAVNLAENIRARAIVIFAANARRITEFTQLRPQHTQIVIITSEPPVVAHSTLIWGVRPFFTKQHSVTMDQCVQTARRLLQREKIAKKGDNIIVVFGVDRRFPWQSRSVRQITL